MEVRFKICYTILAIKFEWNLNLDQNKISFLNLNAGVRIGFWSWNNRTLKLGCEDDNKIGIVLDTGVL